VGKPPGKWQLGGPRRRWQDNMKMDLSQMGCVGVNWIRTMSRTGLWY